jgi:hypothetical protein
MKKFLQRLFCKHDYRFQFKTCSLTGGSTSWRECNKCGHKYNIRKQA